MIILLPTNIDHAIRLVPRFYPTSEGIDIFITNEATKANTTLNLPYAVSNGHLSFTLPLVVKESDRYKMTIKEDDNILFRGKLFVTSQETQTFKLTKDAYYYE